MKLLQMKVVDRDGGAKFYGRESIDKCICIETRKREK